MKLASAIGILGGTFDPIHYGHLRTALDLQQSLNLSEIRFIPCKQPVHKAMPTISTTDRIAMLKLATQDQKGFVIDTCELDRATPSYMIETLATLRAELPTTPLCLILGFDAFLGLPTWQEWEQLSEFAHFIIVKRGVDTAITDKKLLPWVKKQEIHDPQLLHEKLAGYILFQKLNTELKISATGIREQIKRGLNPRYLLPDAVLAYIDTHRLYI